jgi:hypothetical protein
MVKENECVLFTTLAVLKKTPAPITVPITVDKAAVIPIPRFKLLFSNFLSS